MSSPVAGLPRVFSVQAQIGIPFVEHQQTTYGSLTWSLACSMRLLHTMPNFEACDRERAIGDFPPRATGYAAVGHGLHALSSDAGAP